MARRTTRRIVLGSMGLFAAADTAMPCTSAWAASSLPRTSLTVLEAQGRSLRQWLHRDLPPLANQALWAGAAERLRLRWDVHMPPKPEEDESDDEDEKKPDEDEKKPDEEDAKDEEADGEKGKRGEKGKKDDKEGKGKKKDDKEGKGKKKDDEDERIVTLGAWSLPGKASLAKAIERLSPDAPPLLPGRATHERPIRTPQTLLWLSTTFTLRRGKSTLALGTLLIPTPLMRRLAQTEGRGFRLRWSAHVRGRRHRLAEGPFGEHEAFARLPF